MVLNNIKSTKNRGFTIVELLVVIVVIGILATITIVSYTGITTRAKGAKALANANSIQQVAELYNADAGYYPPTIAAFSAGTTASKPASINLIAGTTGAGGLFTAPSTDPATAANGETTVTWACSPTCTTPTGGRITYWDYSNATPQRGIIYVGTGKSNTDYVLAPAS